ncbi:hypothetical protein RF679_15950 [Undibacterium cyanobacteriorum]|uniref:GIY-YIG domain-containing protein n=1 Tax=Undibacterium cyanobacteriorum TaxID=3073561 RepID=A0ABY9RIL3_9BURK|nr:hypothetical protein [Undibacterium sp. 20NA77.5]WMW80125.1 hypothetical protein RF679_15950 [Undibacterium sp. 20NA77.5]
MKQKKIRSLQKIGNTNDKIHRTAQEKLGLYVYVLVDPRTAEVFYVGKGGGTTNGNERVLHHFKEAKKFAFGEYSKVPSSKTKRILEIWDKGYDVQWWIIRHGIEDQRICDQIEAAVIDAFSLAKSKILNAIRGYGAKQSGLISSKDVTLLNPAPVNPRKKHSTVFLFPINQLMGERKDLYEATRKYWSVSKKWRDIADSIAIGVNNQTSAACFSIDKWRKCDAKFSFTGHDMTDNHELARKNLSLIIENAKGYWQRGGFLIVEFDGKNHFRYLRGSKNKEWIKL